MQHGRIRVIHEQQCIYQVSFSELSQINHQKVIGQCYGVLAQNPMSILRVILAGHHDFMGLFLAMKKVGHQDLAICHELAVLCHLRKPLDCVVRPKFHQFDLVAQKQHLVDYAVLLSELGFEIRWFLNS